MSTETIPVYDPLTHLLLCDQAHLRRIHSKDEYEEYVRRVEAHIEPYADRMVPFLVEIPEWPPVKRSPLQLMFGGSGPFEKIPWKGQQLAVVRNGWNNRATFKIAREMVPNVYTQDRLAYQWQCAIFDVSQHTVIRYWCKENKYNIVKFWREYFSKNGDLDIVLTTNPTILEEKKRGSYSPTRRCVNTAGLEKIRQDLLGIKPEPKVEEEKPEMIKVPRREHDTVGEAEEQAQPKTFITLGAITYASHVVVKELEKALGRDCRLFGKHTSDLKIVAMTRSAMEKFLEDDQTDKMIYVLDQGERNFDCENFSELLRNSLQVSYGMNGIGVVWGDAHAWCFFVIAGSKTPEIVFVEPQTDTIVEKLENQYSIKRRCEILL